MEFFSHSIKISTPGGTRTPDQRIRNPLLYPAELRARRSLVTKALS
jgi:hypothetical protein